MDFDGGTFVEVHATRTNRGSYMTKKLIKNGISEIFMALPKEIQVQSQ